MSRGNIETGLDAWISQVEGDDAGNKADVRDYLRGLTTPAEDTVTISINLSACLISALEYLECKTSLANLASEKFDTYNTSYTEADLLQNQVIRGTRSKTAALKFIDDIISANDECFQLFRTFIIKEPSRDPFEGCQILLGRNSFNSNVDDANVIAALNEGRNQDIHVGLRTLEEQHVPDRRAIPFFENRHQHLVGLYAIIQGLKSEKEELQVNVARLSKHLRKDLLELGKEVFEDEGDEMAPSVIRDLLEQVSEISRRYLEIRTKTDEDPKIPPIALKEFDPVTTSYRTLSYTTPR